MILYSHANDYSTVLQERRLHMSALITHDNLSRGRTAFIPAPDIFEDGKLNLLLIIIYFIIFHQLYICPPKMYFNTAGLNPSPIWAHIPWCPVCDSWCDQKLNI